MTTMQPDNQTIEKASKLHHEAMEIYEKALVYSNLKVAIPLFQKAYDMEIAAIDCIKEYKDYEPSRSILYCSAATIAFHAREPSKVKELLTPVVEESKNNKKIPETIKFKLKTLLNQALNKKSSFKLK
jgi:hypothetical protein